VSPIRPPRAAALLAVGLLAGCTTHHYVVVRDGAALYDAPAGGRAIATMPRYHNQPLDEEPEAAGGRVRLEYAGRRGWAARDAVRVFGYLDPDLDDGADQAETVRRELRELQIDDLGGDWDPAVVAAVRDERVLPGMTRQQVEVAWGWPTDVEGGPEPGGETWVYRTRTTKRVRRWADATRGVSAWGPTYWGGPWDDYPWRGSYHPYWGRGFGPGYYGPATVTYRVPVEVVTRVEFDADGAVRRVRRENRLLDS